MEKRESTFFKLDWPFKGLCKGVKNVTVSIVDFLRYDELCELSGSLDSSMTKMTESLEKLKKSMGKYREYSEILMAKKLAEQNFLRASNELTGKNMELERIVTEVRNRSYLRNKIWQNRQN